MCKKFSPCLPFGTIYHHRLAAGEAGEKANAAGFQIRFRKPVEYVLALFFGFYQSGVFQDCQVAGNGGLGKIEKIDYFRHRAGFSLQHQHYLLPGGVGQGFENRRKAPGGLFDFGRHIHP